MWRVVDAYKEWTRSNDVSGVSETIGKVRHLDINGGFACEVQSVDLSWTERGKPMSERAIETITLKKTSAGWRITGWVCADL
jgi:hypothetical protein